MATYHCSIKNSKPGYARKHAEYIMREGKYSAEQSGREDLVYKETFNLPEWAETPIEFWKAADDFERANGIVYFEFEIALPNELSKDENIKLAKEFAQSTIGSSKVYTIAIHNKPAELNPEIMQPHAHIIFSEKIMEKNIKYSKEQFFKRYNSKTPGNGGCKKDDRFTGKNGVGPNNILKVRKRCEEIINKHLELKNINVRVSADSLHTQYEKAKMNNDLEKAKEFNRDPEPHLGPKLIKNEKVKAKQFKEKHGDEYTYYVKFATEKMCRAYLLREMRSARKEFKYLQEEIHHLNILQNKNINIVQVVKKATEDKIVGRELSKLITQHLSELQKDRYFMLGRKAYYQKCLLSKDKAVSYAQSIYTRGETVKLNEEYKNINRIELKYNEELVAFKARHSPNSSDRNTIREYEIDKQRLANWGTELSKRKAINDKKIVLMKEYLAKPEAAAKIEKLIEAASKKYEIWQQKIGFYDQNLKIVEQQIAELKELRSDLNHSYYQNRLMNIDKNYIDHLKNGKSSKNLTKVQLANISKIKGLIRQVRGIINKLEKGAKGGIHAKFKLDKEYEEDERE